MKASELQLDGLELKTAREFSLILADRSVEMVASFNEMFEALPRVSVLRCDFQRIPDFDCMTSPGNSFGLMDGGVDAAITKYFGRKLPRRVQAGIMKDFDGEQPVGTCLIVPTESCTYERDP